MSETFAPWRENQTNALLAAGGAVAFIGAAAIDFIDWSIAIPVAAILLLTAGVQTNIAKARKFGKAFEQRAIFDAVKVLPHCGIKPTPNWTMPAGGDVDLLVERNGKRATIEIKSFIRWTQVFFFWNGPRERKAVRQACMQRSEAKASVALIWLPQGKRGLLSFSRFPSAGAGVRLVYGDVDELVAALKEYL